MDDADVKSNIENSQKNELNEPLPAMGCLPLLTLHVVVGFTPLFLIDKFTSGIVSTTCLTEISRLSWSLKILFISIAVIVGVPLMGAIGSGMFSAFSITLKSLMKAIDFIEAETPTGTVGIIGFFLLTSGFILQFIATFLTL